MAVERVVVDRRLRVEGDDFARGVDDQRVDLDQRRVFLLGDLGHLHEDRCDLVGHFGRDFGLGDDCEGRFLGETVERVDVLLDQGAGVDFGDGFDVHAAHVGEHDQQLLGRAVEDDRGVVLGFDLGADLDPEFVDLERAFAVRADDVHADDVAGVLVGLGDLDAAGLAATSDQNLGFDCNRVTERIRGCDSVFYGCGVAAFRNRKTVSGEEFFTLIFE